MKKVLVFLLAVVVLSGAFLADSISAFPPNDWQRGTSSILPPWL